MKSKKNLTEKGEKELKELLAEKRMALHAFRFGIAGSKVRNVKEGKDVKKEIARALTELNARKAAK